jgi:hypothetical protein
MELAELSHVGLWVDIKLRITLDINAVADCGDLCIGE